MIHVFRFILIVIFSIVSGCAKIPEPPKFTCIQPSQCRLVPFSEISQDDKNQPSVYGLGLSYKSHIKEVTTRYRPQKPPPVFMKNTPAMVSANTYVDLPDQQALLASIAGLDTDLKANLEKKYAINDGSTNQITAALDYEVELGIVLLEDIANEHDLDNDLYAPRIGYLLANDLSSRSIQTLGDGFKDDEEKKYRFWSAAKSFPGFLVVSPDVWVPEKNVPNEMFCIDIVCELNGEEVQRESTTKLLFTPRKILKTITSSKNQLGLPTLQLKKGDVILTGTPGGVAFGTISKLKLLIGEWSPFQIPVTFKLASVLSMERSQKKALEQEKTITRRFLQPGDTVRIYMDGFEQKSLTTIIKGKDSI